MADSWRFFFQRPEKREKGKMDGLKRIKRMIQPRRTVEETEEVKDQDQGHGRKGERLLSHEYLAELSMDFYSEFATSGKKKDAGQTTIRSVRVPTYIAKDIGVIIASRRTRFKDFGEFARTFLLIGLHYYSKIIEDPKFKEHVQMSELLEMIRQDQEALEVIPKLLRSFDYVFRSIRKISHKEINETMDKYLEGIARESRLKIRERILKGMARTLIKYGYDPTSYPQLVMVNSEKEGEEEVES